MSTYAEGILSPEPLNFFLLLLYELQLRGLRSFPCCLELCNLSHMLLRRLQCTYMRKRYLHRSIYTHLSYACPEDADFAFLHISPLFCLLNPLLQLSGEKIRYGTRQNAYMRVPPRPVPLGSPAPMPQSRWDLCHSEWAEHLPSVVASEDSVVALQVVFDSGLAHRLHLGGVASEAERDTGGWQAL